ncbi:hypothetical protein [Phenylobacterium sp.]|uniref:hypothetical protein n=1 Tax=Phenylobacterium sp. TaxID=1871053 RepID=UPI00301BE6BB
MRLFPPPSPADRSASRAASIFLGVCAVFSIGPGAIHSFLPDGGAEAIAGLDLGDRRDLVISIFAWQGSTQIAFGLAMAAVALRYRALTPLFLLLLAVERTLMTLHAWVLKPGGQHHPPEHYASPATAALALIFLAIALRRRAA